MTPAMNQEDFEANDFVLIRHGLSEFNYRALVAKNEFGKNSEQFRAVETSTDLIDPELHEIGIMQAENH
jgi:hypothetical protein